VLKTESHQNWAKLSELIVRCCVQSTSNEPTSSAADQPKKKRSRLDPTVESVSSELCLAVTEIMIVISCLHCVTESKWFALHIRVRL